MGRIKSIAIKTLAEDLIRSMEKDSQMILRKTRKFLVK